MLSLMSIESYLVQWNIFDASHSKLSERNSTYRILINIPRPQSYIIMQKYMLQA